MFTLFSVYFPHEFQSNGGGHLTRKHIVTVLLLIGLIFVIYNATNRTQHGDRGQWIKEHGEVVNRRGNVDNFCIKCHTKQFKQTKENFCNTCHAKNNIPPVK